MAGHIVPRLLSGRCNSRISPQRESGYTLYLRSGLFFTIKSRMLRGGRKKTAGEAPPPHCPINPPPPPFYPFLFQLLIPVRIAAIPCHDHKYPSDSKISRPSSVINSGSQGGSNVHSPSASSIPSTSFAAFFTRSSINGAVGQPIEVRVIRTVALFPSTVMS